MKAKLLKKIRKRYSWYWDKKPLLPSEHRLVVSDHKHKSVQQYQSIRQFIIDIAYDWMGVVTGMNYEIRLKKRNNYAYYKKINK